VGETKHGQRDPLCVLFFSAQT